MVSELFTGWEYSDAELLKVDTRDTEFPPVSVTKAAEEAKDVLEIEARDYSGYVVPLFTRDDPTPTEEYVIYDPEKGSIRWFDEGLGVSGGERSASCDRLSETVIAYRMRYWLHENQSDAELPFDRDELPPDRVEPIEELDEDEEEEFFRDLSEFVESERESEEESNWEHFGDLGLDEAIRRNQVSGPFLLVRRKIGTDGKPCYTLQYELEDDEYVNLRGHEGLFEGNRCIAAIQTDLDDFPIEVELLEVDDPNITIRPEWGKITNENIVDDRLDSNDVEVWLHELLNPVPFDRRLHSIKEVRKDADKRDLLTGKREIRYEDPRLSILDSEIELDQYQQLGLLWADSAEDIVCLHGPPGTGKTRTLTAFVKGAVSKGKKVLVTAHSNQAVDNLLVGDSTPNSPEEDTLHAMAEDPENPITIARQGSNSKSRVVHENYTGKSVSNANVVASTTSGAAKFDQNSFDVAVVDEATQASRPATSIVLNCAKKLVLAGDHKQLPPYCSDETMKEEDMHISLFEYFLDRYGDSISVLLQRQYRMNEEIAEFPNQAFYDGNLETATRNQKWRVDDLEPVVGISVKGTEKRQARGSSYYNTNEAEEVVRQIETILESGVRPENIGVITAYSGQIGQIGGRVNQLDLDNPERITIDTVDSFQGGEREAIIVSFVRSNDDGHSGFLEFPEEGPRRLNVALTRARKRLVLVGNWETLATIAPHRTDDDSCANLYADLTEQLRMKDRMTSFD